VFDNLFCAEIGVRNCVISVFGFRLTTLKYATRHIFYVSHKEWTVYMKNTRQFLSVLAITIILAGANFVTVQKSIVQADPARENWQLTVSGLTIHPLNLSLTDIQALPKTSVSAAIYCVDRPGYLVQQGNWTGVSLALLLDQAGVSPEAIKIAFYAKDGYSTDLDLETAKRADIILAYEKDGLPLNEVLRLVVPYKWGYKWLGLLSDIVLVNYDFKGKWESQGYSDEANMTTITVPGPVPPIPKVIAPSIPSPSAPNSPFPSSPPPSPTPSPSNFPESPLPASPSPIIEEKPIGVPLSILVVVPVVGVAAAALALRKNKR